MSIKSFSYREFESQPQYWDFPTCDFEKINLVVGKNATGKSRLLSALISLCRLMSGQHVQPFSAGDFHTHIQIGTKQFEFRVKFDNNAVVEEKLSVNGDTKLERDREGKGKIFFEKQNAFIEFELPSTALAIQQKRDRLQHPFVDELAKWAHGANLYRFGSSFGRDRLTPLTRVIRQSDQTNDFGNPDIDPHDTYFRTYASFGETFDKAIIRDMKALGYDLIDVGSDDLRPHVVGQTPVTEPLLGLFVTERDRPNHKTPQFHISQGMFRALALVIHLNAAKLRNDSSLILIDDIGEGLDYDRSVRLIDLLIRFGEQSNAQVIMSSNDRFVMNKVPLKYWCLLKRQGSTVRNYTERNSAKQYEEFKFLGLSNFDLLTSDVF